MFKYACLPTTTIALHPYRIEPVQPDHIQPIRVWRNAQLDVLRQSSVISEEQQTKYFAQNIWPEMSSLTPTRILVSYFEAGRLVGYGGLVYIDWTMRSAEVSFLLDPELVARRETYRRYQLGFFALIKRLAFDELPLTSLTTETYAQRVAHIENIETAGFRKVATFSDSPTPNRQLSDSIMHRCMSADEARL